MIQNSASRILDIIFEALCFCLFSIFFIISIHGDSGLVEGSGYIGCGGSSDIRVYACGAGSAAVGGADDEAVVSF